MYGAGTWATTKEHEEMIRRMLRLFMQTQRRYKTKNRKDSGEEDIQDDERSESTRESKKEDSTHDMDVTKTAVFHSRRSTKDADEQNADIQDHKNGSRHRGANCHTK